IGISMMVLAGLVLLPLQVIFTIGVILVFGHNLLDPITVQGTGFQDTLWYILHQPRLLILEERAVSIFYPVLPWMGLMALGYVAGNLYRMGFSTSRRTLWLLGIGSGATLLFVLLRQFNSYGEPTIWQPQGTDIFTWISFLNTTKYPPSLQFILMSMGPALIFLALSEFMPIGQGNLFVVFGKVPFFFYISHIYLIHALALIALVFTGWDWREYILSAEAFLSGRLTGFGFGLEAVYILWIVVIAVLYPLCRWYQKFREGHPAWGWLSYL
ncbi:MAG TPA: heparan-alpha-glucosaminide N-acetyltransferase domain-containing protein, partial [Anaerolineales bacterium]|nr:heparan-alpha-glucosaminide N-acetyltransferase domain-containing protein [Anaerolineales bacterium]